MMPLPAFRHVPGRNARHADEAFDWIKAQCPNAVTDANAADNAAWQYGLFLLTEAYDWEAHEVLEAVWLNTHPNSRERALVQGVIQLANGGLKLTMDRPAAAGRLAGLARERFITAFANGAPILMGVKASAAMAFCDALASGMITPRYRQSMKYNA